MDTIILVYGYAICRPAFIHFHLYRLITHADDSRVRKAFNGVCVCMSVCMCPKDETKMAEAKITKLGTVIVHRDLSPASY